MDCHGLVLTLADPAAEAAVRRALAARPAITAGTLEGRWLPVAIEAAGPVGSLALHDWLRGLPGVDHVDVVHVAFDPVDPHPET